MESRIAEAHKVIDKAQKQRDKVIRDGGKSATIKRELENIIKNNKSTFNKLRNFDGTGLSAQEQTKFEGQAEQLVKKYDELVHFQKNVKAEVFKAVEEMSNFNQIQTGEKSTQEMMLMVRANDNRFDMRADQASQQAAQLKGEAQNFNQEINR